MPITITPAPPLPLTDVGSPAAWGPFVASGGTAPYTYSISSGSLPPGLTLNADGTVTGNTTTVGTYAFTVEATDSTMATGTQDYSNVYVDGPATVTPSTLPDATAGVAYSQQLTASAGIAPYTFALAGADTIIAQVQGSQYRTNLQYNTSQYEYNSAFRTQGSVGAGVLTNYVIATGFNANVPAGATITGITAKLTWQGQNAGTGILQNIALYYQGKIIGTIKSPATANAAVSTTDSYGSGADLWGAALTPAIVNDPSFGFGVQIETEESGGSDRSFLFTFEIDVTYGNLPQGLSLSSSGLISGIPTAPPGTYNFTVVVTDGAGYVTDVPFSLNVDALPVAQSRLIALPPAFPDSCLREGRKIVSYAINWASAAFNDTILPPFPQYGSGAAWWAETDCRIDTQTCNMTALQGLLVSIQGLDDSQMIAIDTGDGSPILLSPDFESGTVYAQIPVFAPPSRTFKVYFIDLSGSEPLQSELAAIVCNIGLTNFKLDPLIAYGGVTNVIP